MPDYFIIRKFLELLRNKLKENDILSLDEGVGFFFLNTFMIFKNQKPFVAIRNKQGSASLK